MKKIKFTITTSSGEKQWKGYQSSTPGLAICGGPYHDIDAPVKSWRITHLASGKVVPYCTEFDRRWQAEKVARDLAQFADWTQSEEEISSRTRTLKPTAIGRIAHQFDKREENHGG